MRVSYNKLWKLLIDKNMKKGELRDAIGASKAHLPSLAKIKMLRYLSCCRYVNI